MFQNFVQFINKLRESEDATKKRWLIIFAAPTMFLIVAGWAFMLMDNLPPGDYGEIEKKSNFSQSTDIFKRGASIIGARFVAGGTLLTAELNRRFSRSQEVFSPNLKFYFEDIESIDPKRL